MYIVVIKIDFTLNKNSYFFYEVAEGNFIKKDFLLLFRKMADSVPGKKS